MPSLNFTFQFQQHLNWCWAAVCIAVKRYYEPADTLTQCQLVNATLPRNDCCNFLAIAPWSPCNVGQNTGAVLASAAINHSAGDVDDAITFDQVRDEIDGGRPIALAVAWYLGGSHAINCTGYYQSLIGSLLLIKDPTFGVSVVSYAMFPMLYWGSLGTWARTYYTA